MSVCLQLIRMAVLAAACGAVPAPVDSALPDLLGLGIFHAEHANR